MIRQKSKVTLNKKWVDIGLIIVGSFLVAYAFNGFLLPSRLVSGGLNGLTIVLFQAFHLSPSLVIYSVNIVLLILALFLLGKDVFSKSILGSLLVPFFISLTHSIHPVSSEPLLASIYGGLLAGLGIGLVFKGNGSTGGTALIAKLIQHFTKLKLGVLLGLCDGFVILTALFVFDIQLVLYALMSLFITSRVVDMVQVGPDLSKNLLIISPKYEEIRILLMDELDCGVTYVPIEGGHTLDQKKMIMTTIHERDYIKIKEAVLSVDSESFIVTSSAHEVYGKGFTLFNLM